MKLDKRDVLRKISTLGIKLRCNPDGFVSIDGKENIDVTMIRLNRLGKCLELGCYLIEKCADGDELTGNNKSAYDDFMRYLKECHDAFDTAKVENDN